MMKHAGLQLALSVLLLFVLSHCGQTTVTRTFADGPVEGLVQGDTFVFRGLPFAKPPVGALRFAPPLAPDPWTNTRDATHTLPRCAQLTFEDRIVDDESSEDCLYLNVWAPKGVGPFPVMVFFPGGAYVLGDAAHPDIEGKHLSERGDVVVVTTNYRLGPFGFLAHPAFAREAGRSTGDFALLDQRAALQWVQRNIETVGGDPNNVTIFGQSAGAGSVCMHLISPGSKGLFHKAIMESPLCTATPLPTRDEAALQADDLALSLGCSGDDTRMRACLREASTTDVLTALPLNRHLLFGEGVAWQPIVDGVTITDQPTAVLATGVTRDIPLIVGSNADEGSLFFAKDDVIENNTDIRSMLLDVFDPAQSKTIANRYPGGDDPQDVANTLVSDLWTCDARRITRLHRAAGGQVYHYYFTRKFYDVISGLGAVHSAEIPFVFDTSLQKVPILPIGIPLTRSMQRYWTSFARQGVPTGGSKSWPAYDTRSDESLRLDLQLGYVKGVRSEACDFWDSIVP